MKKAFSLLELIIVIVVIGIISSYAIPKYMNTRDQALASTIKRDIVTTISSIQSYYLINRKIDKISDALVLNKANWQIEDKKIQFLDNGENCVDLELEDEIIKLQITPSSGKVCKSLSEIGVTSQDIDLI
jgi:general secretion pathway protein G